MTLQQLRYAIGIAETGSFNKAAEKLYVSQPSLTAAIRDLEDELNILIFNRTSRGVSLTSEGEENAGYSPHTAPSLSAFIWFMAGVPEPVTDW